MTLTDTINDIVAQAAKLLAPPDMSDWMAPPGVPDELAVQLEREEYDRRAQKRIDDYLADRSDRLACLRAIRRAASEREDHYGDQAVPWQRMAERQRRLVDYCDQLARNVLVAERAACGGNEGEPYRVELPDGQKIGIKITKVVIVSDIDSLPGKYVRTKTTRDPDKVSIKKALDGGEVVPGARIGTNEHVDWGR